MERLKRIDKVIGNFKDNKVSMPIDLSDFDVCNLWVGEFNTEKLEKDDADKVKVLENI